MGDPQALQVPAGDPDVIVVREDPPPRRRKRRISRNGFMQFALRHQRMYGLPLQEAIDAASEVWPSMDEEARRPYKAQAMLLAEASLRPCPRRDCTDNRQSVEMMMNALGMGHQ